MKMVTFGVFTCFQTQAQPLHFVLIISSSKLFLIFTFTFMLILYRLVLQSEVQE